MENKVEVRVVESSDDGFSDVLFGNVNGHGFRATKNNREHTIVVEIVDALGKANYNQEDYANEIDLVVNKIQG